MDRIFKPPFSMAGVITQDRESCQFVFCLMKTRCCTWRLGGGERSGGRDATALFFAPSFMTLFSTNAEAMKKVILPRKEDRFYREEKWSIRHRIELYDATV